MKPVLRTIFNICLFFGYFGISFQAAILNDRSRLKILVQPAADTANSMKTFNLLLLVTVKFLIPTSLVTGHSFRFQELFSISNLSEEQSRLGASEVFFVDVLRMNRMLTLPFFISVLSILYFTTMTCSESIQNPPTVFEVIPFPRYRLKCGGGAYF